MGLNPVVKFLAHEEGGLSRFRRFTKPYTDFGAAAATGGPARAGAAALAGRIFVTGAFGYRGRVIKELVLGQPAGAPMEDDVLRRLKKEAKASAEPQVDKAPINPYGRKIRPPDFPDLPQRRLQALGRVLDTSPLLTRLKRIQTVQEALGDRTYGQLLHRPITNETVEVPYSQTADVWNDFQQTQKDKAEAFHQWMFDERDPKTQVGYDHDLYSCGALFLSFGNKNGTELETGLVFGIDTITYLANHWVERSHGARFKVRSTIPTNLKPKKKPGPEQVGRVEYDYLELTNLGYLAKRIGVNDFPIKVPEFLIKSLEERDIEIESLPELIGYVIDQLDGLIGQFPVELQITDTDPLKEGNQSQTLKIHNIAETLAEILGQVITSNVNNEALVNICLRTLMQSGSATVAAVVAQDYARANSEFLGYEIQEVQRKIGLSYTPQKDDLQDILQEKEDTIKSVQNKDKQDLNDYLQELLSAASIIRAVHTRKFDTAGNLTKQIKDLLLNQKDLAEEKPQDKKAKSRTDDDWDKFTESVERGWIDEGGVSDTTHPYGRNFDERPRIREIGKPPDAK